jgi:tRNA(Arg) A34 adenosine deaminase TadA
MDQPIDPSAVLDSKEMVFLEETIALARRAREAGDHPFGAILVKQGEVVARAVNAVHSASDPLQHAEFRLLTAAHEQLDEHALRECTLYSSTEPCAMCCGAIFWSGVRRIVFALGAKELGRLAGGRFVVPSRQLLAHALEPVEIIGPVELPGARAVHEGFWTADERREV